MGGRDSLAGKRPANLSINAKLLERPGLKINLSQTLEERLAEIVREAEACGMARGQIARPLSAYNARS